MKVYFISGLGADERIFKFLQLQFCEPVFLQWIPPAANETLASYAARLAELIHEPSPVVVGLSFGGMIATEIGKLKKEARIVLLSSAKTYKEVPPYYRMFRKFPLHNWMPAKFSQQLSRPVVKYLLGAKGTKEKQVLDALLHDIDMSFDLWAVNAILSWQNLTIPPNLVHIHGTGDKILPYKYAHPHITIPNGTHSMVMNEAPMLSAWLKKFVEEGITAAPDFHL